MRLSYLKEQVQPKQRETRNYREHCRIFAGHGLGLFSRFLYTKKNQHNRSEEQQS